MRNKRSEASSHRTAVAADRLEVVAGDLCHRLRVLSRSRELEPEVMSAVAELEGAIRERAAAIVCDAPYGDERLLKEQGRQLRELRAEVKDLRAKLAEAVGRVADLADERSKLAEESFFREDEEKRRLRAMASEELEALKEWNEPCTRCTRPKYEHIRGACPGPSFGARGSELGL